MEQRNRIAQLYGYAVCLACVITFLVSVGTLVGAMFELSDPLHASAGGSYYRQPSLASFENYKMDVLRPPQEGKELAAQGYTPDDQTLRTMYDAAKNDRIQYVRLQARRTITVDTLLIGVCFVLFVLHWVWLRRIGRRELSPAGSPQD